ncbi:MAG TPA: glycosyltransferase family 39 protein [Candidatus Paceibacterota bacterium]|nr:glycosyltransferase family 39 protein [Candidatus Paceibacterota bacterium]
MVQRRAASLPPWAIPAFLLTLITLLAAFLSFYEIGKLSFWNDELSTVGFINQSVFGTWKSIWPREMNMSLYYLIANLWMHLFTNPSEGTLRIISAAFFIASIPAIFFLGKSYTSDEKAGTMIGLLAALFASLNAFLIQYAQELRAYSLFTLLTVLSTLFLIKAVEKRVSRKLWIAYVLVSAAGFYTQYLFALVILSQVIALGVLFSRHIKLFPFVKLVRSFFILIILILPLVIAAHIVGKDNTDWIGKPTILSIGKLVLALTGNGGIILVLAYVACIGVGTFLRVHWQEKDGAKDWVTILFLNALFLPLILVLLLSTVGVQLFVNRYFIFCIPFLVILAAIGITKLFYKPLWGKTFAAILLISIVTFSVVGLKSYFTNYQKEDWRDLTGYLLLGCGSSNDLRLYYPIWTTGLYFLLQPSGLYPKSCS